MIQYAERLEEVVDILRHEFAVEDTQALELLLAARLECALPYPWIVLETPYYRLVPDGAWFSGIYQNAITPLPLLRTVRPRQSNVQIQQLLKERGTWHLFIETYFEMPPTVVYQFRMWPYLLQECVRIRTPYPKSALPDERAGLLLEKAVERVLDFRWRDLSSATMPKPPPSLPYWCELLQRLSPTLRDWDSLMTNLCALAGRRALLFNRHVDSTDWVAVSRVMRDSIPDWVRAMLNAYRSRGRLKSLRGLYDRNLLEREMKRLLSEGVLQNHRGEWIIRDLGNRGRDFLELTAGPNICCT